MLNEFWSAVVIVGVVLLVIAVLEAYEKWKAVVFPDQRNTHQQERDRQLDSLTLASRYPPASGPKGYEAEGERRAAILPISKRRLH